MKPLLTFIALLAFAIPAQADDVHCFALAATPEDYFGNPGAPATDLTGTYSPVPGSVMNVTATFTNCGTEGYVQFGGRFGADWPDSPYLDQYASDFIDPSGFLGPGESQTWPFMYIIWTDEAPVGYVWNGSIYAEGVFLEAPCGFIDTPECVYLDVAPYWASGSYTATVVQPASEVPEPSTLIMIGTGIGAMAVRLRRRRSPSYS